MGLTLAIAVGLAVCGWQAVFIVKAYFDGSWIIQGDAGFFTQIAHNAWYGLEYSVPSYTGFPFNTPAVPAIEASPLLHHTFLSPVPFVAAFYALFRHPLSLYFLSSALVQIISPLLAYRLAKTHGHDAFASSGFAVFLLSMPAVHFYIFEGKNYFEIFELPFLLAFFCCLGHPVRVTPTRTSTCFAVVFLACFALVKEHDFLTASFLTLLLLPRLGRRFTAALAVSFLMCFYVYKEILPPILWAKYVSHHAELLDGFKQAVGSNMRSFDLERLRLVLGKLEGHLGPFGTWVVVAPFAFAAWSLSQIAMARVRKPRGNDVRHALDTNLVVALASVIPLAVYALRDQGARHLPSLVALACFFLVRVFTSIGMCAKTACFAAVSLLWIISLYSVRGPLLDFRRLLEQPFVIAQPYLEIRNVLKSIDGDESLVVFDVDAKHANWYADRFRLYHVSSVGDERAPRRFSTPENIISIGNALGGARLPEGFLAKNYELKSSGEVTHFKLKSAK